MQSLLKGITIRKVRGRWGDVDGFIQAIGVVHTFFDCSRDELENSLRGDLMLIEEGRPITIVSNNTNVL